MIYGVKLSKIFICGLSGNFVVLIYQQCIAIACEAWFPLCFFIRDVHLA